MQIAEQLVLLAELSSIEKKLRDRRYELETRPAAAQDADGKTEKLKAELEVLDKQRFEADRAKRTSEQDVATERDNLRKWQARAENIRGEREHEALKSEIGGLRRRITHLENDQLEVMQKLEDLDGLIVPKMKEHEDAATNATAEWKKCEDDLNRLGGEVKSQDAIRSKLLGKLPPAVVTKYAKIAEQRKGLGVAIIKGEMCSACRRTLPPQLCLQVYKGAILEGCPSCQRILVHEASTRSTTAEDEAAS